MENDKSGSTMWHDLSRAPLYPLGWCQMTRSKLRPPQSVATACPGWEALALKTLEDVSVETISMHHVDGRGQVTPAERISEGMWAEVRSEQDPKTFWPAKVVESAGGLLKLRYHLGKDDDDDCVTLFFDSERLRPLKHAKGAAGASYLPPPSVSATAQDAEAALEQDRLVPSDLLNPSLAPPHHSVKEGQLAELVGIDEDGPRLCRVTRVFDETYYEVSLVGQEDRKVACHSRSVNIFPIGWTKSFAAKHPKLIKESLMADMEEQLEKIGEAESVKQDASEIAPTNKHPSFEEGQKMEVMHRGRVLRTATVAAVFRNVLALKVDVCEDEEEILVLTHTNSNLIFPFMWGQTSGQTCHMPPEHAKFLLPSSDDDKTEDQGGEDEKGEDEKEDKKDSVKEEEEDGHWCPPIYFNYKCASASFLSKARLAGLPRSVGPGSTRLVMLKVLELIVGASYKSASVLKRLECEEGGVRRGYLLECVKGKSRAQNLRGNVEIPTKSGQVGAFCREVCSKLGACPNLVSPTLYAEGQCPDGCQSKSRMGAAATFEQEEKGGRGRKAGKKRRHHFQSLNNRGEEQEQEGGNEDGEDESSGSESSEPPTEAPSNAPSRCASPDNSNNRIQTRGARQPDYRQTRPAREDENENDGESNNNKRAKLMRRVGGGYAPEPAFDMADLERRFGGRGAVQHHRKGKMDFADAPIRPIRVSKNPEEWSCQDTAKFLAQTADCAHLAHFMLEDEVDGLSFMLLNYPTAKGFWRLTPASATNLCRHVESVKLAFYNQTSTTD